jgi:hypothetical protein
MSAGAGISEGLVPALTIRALSLGSAWMFSRGGE